MLQTRSFHDPAGGEIAALEISQHGKGFVGGKTDGTFLLPCRTESGGVGIGDEQLMNGIGHRLKGRRFFLLRIPCECLAPCRILFGIRKFRFEICRSFSPKRCQLGANSGAEFFQLGNFLVVASRRIGHSRGPAGRHKHAGERVVVALRDGVELVIVAAGAGNGKPEEGLAERVNFVVHHLLMDAVELKAIAVAMLAQMHEHRADDALVELRLGVNAWLGQ